MSYSTTAPGATLLSPPPRRLDLGSILVLALFLLISAAVAFFGTVTTISTIDGWYADAVKVPWSPPNWLFGPVWTLLYAAMAVSAWLVWRRRLFYVGPALALYIGQLFLNSVWTPVFFGGYEIIGSAALWIGLAVIVLLDVCVTATIVAFWYVSRPAAVLLMPYLAWILFASTLNLGLAILNT
jgi:translocator protein